MSERYHFQNPPVRRYLFLLYFDLHLLLRVLVFLCVKITGITVNMMPFYLYDLSSLPKNLQAYRGMIETCKKKLNLDSDDKEYVAYLTITESKVEKGKTQRRPGLHVEKPHSVGSGTDMFESMFGGPFILGGIFMASNRDSTCQLWNAQIESSVVGWEGDIEHLRDHLNDVCVQNTSHTPKSYIARSKIRTRANTMYWITDKTPHESLPLKVKCKRQFFRLVAGPLTTWHAVHNTPNPNGVMPACKIVKFDKFKKKPL